MFRQKLLVVTRVFDEFSNSILSKNDASCVKILSSVNCSFSDTCRELTNRFFRR